jgi:hypothetical protein
MHHGPRFQKSAPKVRHFANPNSPPEECACIASLHSRCLIHIVIHIDTRLRALARQPIPCVHSKRRIPFSITRSDMRGADENQVSKKPMTTHVPAPFVWQCTLETSMSKETLISEQIVARLNVGCNIESDDHYRDQSEYGRISEALRVICGARETSFVIYDRVHRILPSWKPKRGTFCRSWANGVDAQIELKIVDQPVQRVFLRYSLRQFRDSAWLTCSFNPTTVLSGNNVHPAAIARADGSVRQLPSSDPVLLGKTLRMGFEILEKLASREAAAGWNTKSFRFLSYLWPIGSYHDQDLRASDQFAVLRHAAPEALQKLGGLLAEDRDQ